MLEFWDNTRSPTILEPLAHFLLMPEHLKLLPSSAQKTPTRKAAKAARMEAARTRPRGAADAEELAHTHSGNE